MMNMVEDIDFDFNPEICDAAMRFINATTYGTAALDSLIAFGEEGMRSKRMTLIKQMKEESVVFRHIVTPIGLVALNARPVG